MNKTLSNKINRIAARNVAFSTMPLAHISVVRSAMQADHPHLDDATFASLLSDLHKTRSVTLVRGDLPSQVKERVNGYAFIRVRS